MTAKDLLAVGRLMEFPAHDLPALAHAVTIDVLNADVAPGWEALNDIHTPMPTMDALANTSAEVPFVRWAAIAMISAARTCEVSVHAVAALTATANGNRDAVPGVVDLLRCAPTDDEALAWAATPPPREKVALILALRGHQTTEPTPA